jgi:hypothetical protein
MSVRKPEEYIVKRRFREFGVHLSSQRHAYASWLVSIILGVSSV